MNEALNQPVRRARRETVTAEMPIGQMDSISLDVDDEVDRQRIVEADAAALQKEYTAALAFGEEPVMIQIARGTEKNASNLVECWCNGKGIEIFTNGRWMESGWVPTNTPITTKRKYVEVLMRSKTTTFHTEIGKPGDEYIRNDAKANTSARNSISILSDQNPLGIEWVRRIMAERE